MKHLPVLIVGAGPSGLMMACELARHGIRFRIIDKNPEPTQGSNATWIQTRTLEIFDAIGMLEPFLIKGHRCNAINFYEKGEAVSSIPLNQIDSLYPYILMLPQSETEKLLIKKLVEYGITVERSSELIDVTQDKNKVTTSIRLKNGTIEKISSMWLIACDGANSTVRKISGIKFPGEDITEQFMVADAQMDSYLPTDEIHVFFDKGDIFPDRATLFSAFPWGSNKYRLSANLYLSHPRKSFTPHEVQETVAERTFGNYAVKSVSWISPFWIHGKIVKQLRHNAIFFVGDAAHIHSPAGGQGMNTGMQDAFNLGWKLALVIKKKAKENLLESYQQERYPIDKHIVKQTEMLTKLAIFDKSFFKKLKASGKQWVKNPSLSKKIANELTQLHIRYKKSPIIDYKKKVPKKSSQQGERIPNVLIENKQFLYDYFHHSLHTVLLFIGDNPDRNTLTRMTLLKKSLEKAFPKMIKLFFIVKNAVTSKKDYINDVNGNLHKHFNITKTAMYVIRPDNYIGYYSNNLSSHEVIKFLKRYMT